MPPVQVLISFRLFSDRNRWQGSTTTLNFAHLGRLHGSDSPGSPSGARPLSVIPKGRYKAYREQQQHLQVTPARVNFHLSYAVQVIVEAGQETIMADGAPHRPR